MLSSKLKSVKSILSFLFLYGDRYFIVLALGLINACAGGIQSYMLPEAADVMWEMIQFCARVS